MQLNIDGSGSKPENLSVFDVEINIPIFSDIDECTSGTHCDPSPLRATCSNTVGSFACACNTGYRGDGNTCTGLFKCCF